MLNTEESIIGDQLRCLQDEEEGLPECRSADEADCTENESGIADAIEAYRQHAAEDLEWQHRVEVRARAQQLEGHALNLSEEDWQRLSGLTLGQRTAILHAMMRSRGSSPSPEEIHDFMTNRVQSVEQVREQLSEDASSYVTVDQAAEYLGGASNTPEEHEEPQPTARNQRPKTWQEVVALAEHYKAIGFYEVYLDAEPFPWEFVTRFQLNPGSPGFPTNCGVEFFGEHPSGIQFRWIDNSLRAEGMPDIDKVEKMSNKLPKIARRSFKEFLLETAESIDKISQENRELAEAQEKLAEDFRRIAGQKSQKVRRALEV
jgi:hypothetical protein